MFTWRKIEVFKNLFKVNEICNLLLTRIPIIASTCQILQNEEKKFNFLQNQTPCNVQPE